MDNPEHCQPWAHEIEGAHKTKTNKTKNTTKSDKKKCHYIKESQDVTVKTYEVLVLYLYSKIVPSE
jgi:hypothetical protein